MDNNDTPVERYSLTTAVCLIVGICIGSGIFFKSDNILIATGGNVFLGVLMFFLAATTIIFGGLTLARYAARTRGNGGLVAYAAEALGPRAVTFIGWHYTFIYMPMVCAIICWVVGVYGCMAFDLPASFNLQMLIGLTFLILCALWNMLWPTLSGYFQNVTTVAKAIPLVVVGVAGLLLADPVSTLAHGMAATPHAGTSHAGTSWVIAAAPIAFAFDGWSSAISIAPEVRDSRRNLPRALVIGPIIILVLYVAYFVGISCYLGPQTVMDAGDASLSLMFARMFGERAAALPNIIAFIAILGTGNGMVMATLRMPQSLALHNQMPSAERVRHINPTLRFPVVSGLLALGAILCWMGVHYVVTALGLLPNADISEIAVGLTLFVLSLFYLRELTRAWQEDEHRVRRCIVPGLATVGSLAIGISSFADPARWPFIVVCLALAAIPTWLVNRQLV